MTAPEPVLVNSAADQRGIVAHYEQLLATCDQNLTMSLSGARAQRQATSQAFVRDMESWIIAVSPKREVALLKSGARAYQYGLLALVLGQYREAFSALRLFLELSTAAVFYSANELMLREWLAGRRDNNWRRFLHADRGVFSLRFADAFCPSLRESFQQYGGIAAKVYRECSQYVHANALTDSALPAQHSFEGTLFDAWHDRAGSAWLVVSFLLYSRYYGELSQVQQLTLEAAIQDQLGHIEQVRDQLARATGQQ